MAWDAFLCFNEYSSVLPDADIMRTVLSIHKRRQQTHYDIERPDCVLTAAAGLLVSRNVGREKLVCREFYAAE